MKYRVILTSHARFEAKRRAISTKLIRKVASKPEQLIKGRKKKWIAQSKYFDELEQQTMLLRVIFEETKDVRKIITVYKTSKIDKYWKKEGDHAGNL